LNEKDQLIYKISNFSPDGTTREISYFNGALRNTWSVELYGSEALLKLDGLVEIIVGITVDTGNSK